MQSIFQRQQNEMTSAQVHELLQSSAASPTPPKRQRVLPARGSKTRAVQKIRDIREWETCSESSALFKRAAAVLDQELAGMRPEEIELGDDEADAALDNGSIHDDDSEVTDRSGDESDGSDDSFVSRDSWDSRDTDWEPSNTEALSPQSENNISCHTSTDISRQTSPIQEDHDVPDSADVPLTEPHPVDFFCEPISPNVFASYSTDA